MLQLKSWKIAFAVGLVFAVLFCVSGAYAQGPVMSPLNPQDSIELPPGMGFIPPRVDLSHLAKAKSLPGFGSVVLPVRWDLRTEGVVTSVKNQGACGSCYAFMSTAAMESRVALDGGGTFDFSENNAKECNYLDPSCGGGNFEMVANVFSQTGTVLETCDPYVASDVSCETSCSYNKALLGWNIISANSIPDPSVIQNYLYTEGPFYTSIFAGDGSASAWQSEFGSYNGSYVLRYTGTNTPNHAALIVGWDDTIPHAGGNGAWIVKNSWGTGWGGTCDYGTEGGFYYIAYGSAGFGKYTSFVNDWQDVNVNDNILFYDEAGWTNQWGYGSSIAWGMVKFTLTEDAFINRVEFWTDDSPTDVDVYVYDDFSGVTLSNLITSELGTTFELAGYHSVQLSSPPEIATGNDIYIAVKFTNNSYGFPVVADGEGPTETGKTYLSPTGSSWSDMGENFSDVAIRVRTSPTLVLSTDDEDEPLPFRFELKNNYPNPFNPTTTIEYTIPVKSEVDISIFNLLGQRVKTIVNGEESAGEHSVSWDGTDFSGSRVASGIYLYRIVAGDNTQTKKMMFIK
ncbi:MAG: C1 family peptidase [bacterium]